MRPSSTDGLISLVRGSKEEIAAIEALRKEAYESAQEFQIANKNAWAWTTADAKAHVLAVWDREGRALATMRGTFAGNCAEAQDQLECTFQLPQSLFPTLVLEKAATKARIAQRGLNALLRYVFLEIAIQYKLGSVIGAVFAGAPRVETMRDLGYQFTVPDRMWDPNFAQHTQVLIGTLPQKELTMASRKLRTLLEPTDTLERFPYRDSLIQLPIVPNDEAAFDVES